MWATATFPCSSVLSGKLDILQPHHKDGERLITTHLPNAFTGEINMISGRRCLVRGRVAEAGEFLEISPDNLRTLIAKDAELSEVFMRAFILRRLALVKQGFGDAVVTGLHALRRPRCGSASS